MNLNSLSFFMSYVRILLSANKGFHNQRLLRASHTFEVEDIAII